VGDKQVEKEMEVLKEYLEVKGGSTYAGQR
jgi:hypothetical protein